MLVVALVVAACVVWTLWTLRPAIRVTSAAEASLPQNACTLPRQSGNCEASLRRYYYDATKGTCTQFVYGGCGGNANNFKTKLACEQRCAADPCTLPPDTANCAARIPFRQKFYFDTKTGKCSTFEYSGCGGNANNFKTEAACKQRCPVPKKV